VFCKQEIEQVICCPSSEEKSFEEFGIWGDMAGPGMMFEEKSNMFFPIDYHQNEITRLEAFICWVPDCSLQQAVFATMKKLEMHLQNEHSKSSRNFLKEATF